MHANKQHCLLFVTDLGACAITAIPFEKSKVLFSLEETDDFVLVDETEPSIFTEHVPEHTPDHARSGSSLEKWGWIMFECGIENLTVKGIILLLNFREHYLKHYLNNICISGV